MNKRVLLMLVGAAVLGLSMAAPTLMALVRTSAPDAYLTPVPFGWSLQLRGAHSLDLTKAQFRAGASHNPVAIVDDNKTPADPSDDVTYKGISLKRLVGLIDDDNPSTFNSKRAYAGKGYGVEVTGIDYFSYVYTSRQVANLGNTLLVADLANGSPLVWGTVKGTAFKPTWPLKLVSSNAAITGKMKPSGILRIRIVAAPAPSPSPSPSGSASASPPASPSAGAQAAAPF
jgi:hypothetical protein